MSVARTAATIGVLCASCAWAQSPTGDGMLRVASSGEHVWVVVPTPARGGIDGARVIHHAPDMGPLGTRVAFEFARPVVDLVATQDELWVVFGPSQPSADGARVYDVASTRVVRNLAVGTYYNVPIGSMALRPQVTADGWRGIAALPGAPAAARWNGSALNIVRPSSMAWDPIDPPSDVDATAWMVPWPSGGVPSAALAQCAEGTMRTWVRTGAAWSMQSWPIPAGSVHVVPGASRPTVVAVDGTSRALYTLTSSGAVRCHTLVESTDPWCVAGRGDRYLVFSERDGVLRLAELSLDGQSSAPAEPVVEQERTTGLWIHLPLIGAITIAALLAVFLMRSGPGAAGVVPAGWEPLALVPRGAALLLDLVPGAVAALWLMNASAAQLLEMPSWTADATAAGPASVMLLVGWLFASIPEAITGASPGKWIVGARVVSTTPGSPWRAPIWRRTVRAALTLVVLFAPALAFLTLIHPALQGLPEQLTRTAVARRAQAPRPLASIGE